LRLSTLRNDADPPADVGASDVAVFVPAVDPEVAGPDVAPPHTRNITFTCKVERYSGNKFLLVFRKMQRWDITICSSATIRQQEARAKDETR
jgi:hypothetical protein